MPTPPPRYHPVLPHPGRAENGLVPCNEPFVVNGQTVGFCRIFVNPRGTRWKRPHWHKGPHRIEWW